MSEKSKAFGEIVSKADHNFLEIGLDSFVLIKR